MSAAAWETTKRKYVFDQEKKHETLGRGLLLGDNCAVGKWGEGKWIEKIEKATVSRF